MIENKRPEIEYAPREELDAQLSAAIGDILSAEEDAKRIVAEAEQSVKSLRAESSAAERALRDKASAELALERDKIIADAEARAEAEVEKKLDSARKASEKLVADKRGLINDAVKRLYSDLGGK